MGDFVLIGGVFDPLHAGHLAYIREAKQHGTVVCALSEQSDRHPPLVPWWDRFVLLSSLGVTVIENDLGIAHILRTLQPKAYIKGQDWKDRLPLDQVEACAEVGAEIIYTDTVTQSSSRLLADYQRRLNTEKLAQFEAWVSTQTPADKPWEPVTDYSFEARKEIEGPHAQIIKDTFKPLFVLDYGAGYGHLVRMLQEIGVKAFGFEPHLDPAEGAEAFVFGKKPYGIAKEWDLVICREVLEHLTTLELVKAVRFLVGVSTRFVYVTTRFTAAPHLLEFDRGDALDPTHISLLNQDLLRTLFVLEGCTRRADLEEKLDHQKKGRVLVYEVAHQ